MKIFRKKSERKKEVMGWTIGMPSLKLNNVGGKSKHCGSFSAVAAEALKERQGRDLDINHEKSKENCYSGIKYASDLEEYSKKHVAELSAKQIANGGRKIRNDAVVMCATIIKPPAAMMEELSKEAQMKFFSDSKRKLAEIVGAENIKSAVIHFDEQGSHMHVFWEPMTPDGRLCAKEVHNLQFLGRLNREMPEHLRSCGWDIADCKAYDQAQEALKSEKERAEERSQKGMSSAAYKAKMEKEKQQLIADVDKLKAEAEIQKNLIQKQKEELEQLESAKGPIGRIGPLRVKIENLQEERTELLRESKELRDNLAAKDIKIELLNSEIKRLEDLRPSVDDDIKRIEAEKIVENLERENTKFREMLEKIMNYLKELFPEAFKAVESLFSQSRDDNLSK